MQEGLVRYRQLGTSALGVPAISLGTAYTIADGLSAEISRRIIDAALDLGISFFDTANVYRLGMTETFLGECLALRPRTSYMLATKLFFPMTGDDGGLSAEQIARQCDASLRRLRTDYIDLYQCHRFDDRVPIEEVVAAMTKLVEAGKIRYMGVGEWSASQLSEACALARPTASGPGLLVSGQYEYSLLNRKHEYELFAACAGNGASVLAWSPLAQGVLSGKYPSTTGPPPGTRVMSRQMGRTIGRYLSRERLEAVEKLGAVADALRLSTAQLALSWVLQNRTIASAIVGVSSPQQLMENARSADVSLAADVMREIELIFRPDRGDQAS